MGPWMGGSIYAVQDGVPRRRVPRRPGRLDRRDDAAGAARRHQNFFLDVDFAHVDRPANVWFAGCNGTTTCWVGQGAGPLRTIQGALEVSFLPLGFRYGG